MGTKARLVAFTHDLDFSALLAATQATGPSIIQVRAEDVLRKRKPSFELYSDSDVNWKRERFFR